MFRTDWGYFIFAIFFLLLILLGDSFLMFYFLGLIGLISLLFIKKLTDKKSSAENSKILITWVIFLIGLTISFLGTISIPLSINIVAYYLAAFLIYIVFYFSVIDKQKFFITVLGTLFIVTCISYLLLAINSFYSFSFPGFNLVFPSYGHNHLASLLIMAIPISWAFYLSSKSRLALFSLIFFTASLLLTSGRTAIFIGLLQIIFIVIFAKQFFSGKKLLKLIASLALIVYLISLVLLLLFSTVFSTNPLCKQADFSQLVCKDSLASRGYYWQQAVDSFREDPLIGSGPGTFGLRSQKYSHLPGFRTNYAHNIYLHNFAELGLFGGGAYLSLMYLFFALSVKVLKQKDLLLKGVFVAVASSYLNALLDFDWHFSSVFFLTLICLSFLIKNIETVKTRQLPFSVKKIGILLASLLLAISLLFAVTDGLTRVKRADLAFKLFPYFQWHNVLFFEELAMTEDQEEQYFQIYKNSPQVIEKLINKETNPEKEIAYYLALNEIDPWNNHRLKVIKVALDQKNITLAADETSRYIRFLIEKRLTSQYTFTHDRYLEITDIALQIGDIYFHQGRYVEAADFYLLAYELTPWSLGEHQNGVELFQPDLMQWDFLEKVSVIEPIYWGQYREAYADYVYGMLEQTLAEKKYSKVEFLLLQLTQAVPWNEASIWNEAIESLLLAGENQLIHFSQTNMIEYDSFELMGSLLANQSNRGNYQLRWRAVQQLQLASEAALAQREYGRAELLTRFMNDITPGEYWVNEQLGNLFLYLGENDKAGEAFDNCLKEYVSHEDCLSGKELIQNLDEEGKNRFFEIGKIIFPVWQRPALLHF